MDETPVSNEELHKQKVWLHEQNLRLAERMHELNIDYLHRANEAAEKSAESATKALIPINGGASISLGPTRSGRPDDRLREIRVGIEVGRSFPGFAPLNPSYA